LDEEMWIYFLLSISATDDLQQAPVCRHVASQPQFWGNKGFFAENKLGGGGESLS